MHNLPDAPHPSPTHPLPILRAQSHQTHEEAFCLNSAPLSATITAADCLVTIIPKQHIGRGKSQSPISP